MNKNIESIKGQLKNYSKKYNKIHQFTLIRYFQERLLFRLSKSKYRNQFLLKGGALIYALQKEDSRPTLDIDLLANHIRANEAILKEVFTEICSINFFDGVVFDYDNIEITEIIKDGNYSGIRVKVIARLGNIKQKMQIDIGAGDIVFPEPIEMEYPTLIEIESPYLLAYSVESLIAEKFHAMIDLGEYNSRMKDFYDIFTILKSKIVNPKNLQMAIKKTFTKRETTFSKNHSLFLEDFYQSEYRIKQWNTFLKKNKLDEAIDFKEVLILIKRELEPIYQQL